MSCSAETYELVVERQPVVLEQARSDAWIVGSGIATLDALTFPQPLTLRFSVVDDAANPKLALPLKGVRFDTYGASQLQVRAPQTCPRSTPDSAAVYCLSEFSVADAGLSMLVMHAETSAGIATTCFYYGVVDATFDAQSLRDEQEAKKRMCEETY